MKLGVSAKDKITGFKGIVMGRAKYLTGCDQFFIQPQVTNNESYVDGKWFDEGRIEVIGDGINAGAVAGEQNGCDITPPSV